MSAALLDVVLHSNSLSDPPSSYPDLGSFDFPSSPVWLIAVFRKLHHKESTCFTIVAPAIFMGNVVDTMLLILKIPISSDLV